MDVGEIKRPDLVGRIKGVVEEMDVFFLIPGVEQLGNYVGLGDKIC